MLIDKHQFVHNLKYPINQTASGQLFGVKFPYKDIQSIVIQSPSLDYYYIKSIKLLKESIQITIKQNSGAIQLYFNITDKSTQSFLLTRDTQLISGNVVYSKYFYNNLLSILKQLGTQLLQNTNKKDLQLDLSCVVLFKHAGLQRLSIDGIKCQTDLVNIYIQLIMCSLCLVRIEPSNFLMYLVTAL